jgi:UDP-N-acetylmuramate dehydrogenase
MKKLKDFSLADHTTLRVGGIAKTVCEIQSPVDIQEFVMEYGNNDFFVLAGGSNIVAPDKEINTPIAFIKLINSVSKHDGDFLEITCGAGVSWDEFVSDAIDQGLAGVETLSGIPGTVGATAIQNVGAYGQEVRSTIKSLQLVDGSTGKVRTLTNEDLKFGYRYSILKEMTSRFIIENITFRLKKDKSTNITAYPEVSKYLNINPGELVPTKDLRKAILDIRKSKGMILDKNDSDTFSVGSFFINPIMESHQIPKDAPRYEQSSGKIKTSAAWLIEQAGFSKGHKLANAYISSKHTLAICNSGNAKSGEIISLANQIQNKVQEKFGIQLIIEPRILNI